MKYLRQICSCDAIPVSGAAVVIGDYATEELLKHGAEMIALNKLNRGVFENIVVEAFFACVDIANTNRESYCYD